MLEVLVIRRVQSWFYVFDLVTGDRRLGVYDSLENAQYAILDWQLLKENIPDD